MRYKNFPYNDQGKPITIAWVGDGNNIIHSLLMSCPKLGLNVNVATPVGYECHSDVVETSKVDSEKYGSKVQFMNDPKDAVFQSDVIVTDTW
eukprot:Awhi_evm1s6415